MIRLFILFLLALGCHLPARPVDESLLVKVLEDYLQEHSFNGSALIGRKENALIAKGFGSANQELKVENTPETEFLIGSITKVFTAAAILKLAERGLIDLSKTVDAYIKSTNPIWADRVPPWASEVTISQLLTHTSGLEEYTYLPSFAQFYAAPHTVQELMSFIVHHPLKFKPGEQYDFSGSGYNLLGAIIEQVSGQGYGKFLDEAFFKPLKMDSTWAADTKMLNAIKATTPLLAKGYIFNPESKKITPASDINMTVAFAEASMISTVLNLFTWTQALFGEKVLSKEYLAKMLTPYYVTESKNVWIGYGIFIDKGVPSNPIYFHSGRINGYESIWGYSPQEEICVILLSNVMGSGSLELAIPLMQLVKESLKD